MDLQNKFNELCRLYKNEETFYEKSMTTDENQIEENLTKENIKNINSNVLNKINDKKKEVEKLLKINNYIKLLDNYITNVESISKSLEEINNDTECCVINNIANEDITSVFTTNKFTDIKNTIMEQVTTINETKLKLTDLSYIINLKISNYDNLLNEYKNMVKNILADESNTCKIMNDMLCTICYEKEINKCITPCGHTICNDCSVKLNGKCFICNQKYTSVVKLFINNNKNSSNNNELCAFNENSTNNNNGEVLNAYNEDGYVYFSNVN